jgi:hypothetical protein
MDIGFAAKPIGSFAPSGLERPDPVAARQAVPTELAPSQSVTAAADTGAARNDAPRRLPSDPVMHDVIIDPATREVIYRAVDSRSGAVLSQVPDQVQLQLAAYTQAVQRAVDKGKTWTEAEAQAELDVQI